MLLSSSKYSSFFIQKTILSIVLLLFFCLSAHAQNDPLKKDSFKLHLHPLLLWAFKKPVKPNPTLDERLKRPTNQLMSWPNYPLTAAQVAERQARHDRPIGKQIVEDILGSYVNGIINGKKNKPVAAIPKF